MSEEKTELGMIVDTREPPPPAWSGGEHDGTRLDALERKHIMDLFAEGCSLSEIRRRLGHGRNTIAAVLARPEVAEKLRETRAARMLLEEEALLRERSDLIDDLSKRGKLKLSDLNSGLMITGIGIKDAGGAAPTRVKVEVEHEFKMAAELMTAGTKTEAKPFMPAPVMEAELVDVTAPNKP
jgi:DNA-binding transcriptional MerR regulator